MQQSCLAEQLGRFCALTQAETDALDMLVIGTRSLRRGTVLRAERDPGGELFVVEQGWLFCCTLLEDGRRQIIRFHLRGDLLGGDGLAFADATDAVVALTDAEVCVLDREAFGRLFAEHPRLGALLYAALQAERVSLTDRLTSLGRNSAKGRVAALLLWVADRLRAADQGQGGRFTLPMTQEEIGDATGLTAVHVNRTMRALEEQGLIERTRATLRLVDTERLARMANQPARTVRLRGGWLPPPAA